MRPPALDHRDPQLDAAATYVRSVVCGATPSEELIRQLSSTQFRDAASVMQQAGNRNQIQTYPLARIALNAVVLSPENIDFGYQASRLLTLLQPSDDPEISHLIDQARTNVKAVLCILGHYDSYVDVRAVTDRKKNLNEAMGGHPVSNAVVTAQQLLGIFQKLCQHYRTSGIAAPGDAMRIVSQLTEKFLHTTRAKDVFSGIGFSTQGPEVEPVNAMTHVRHAFDHNPIPQPVTLSNIPEEYGFIAVHQAFETLFCDIVTYIRAVCEQAESKKGDIDVQRTKYALFHVTALIDAATDLFPALEKVIDKPKFLETVRECFVVASAAQSQQYHTMQVLMGMPFDEQFQSKRMSQMETMIGPHARRELENEMGAKQSLKQIFASSEEMKSARPEFRKLDLALLRLKIQHGMTMLKYLDPDTPGTAGARITQYFADITQPVFDGCFTQEERSQILLLAQKAAETKDQKSDHFAAVNEYVRSLPEALPDPSPDA